MHTPNIWAFLESWEDLKLERKTYQLAISSSSLARVRGSPITAPLDFCYT